MSIDICMHFKGWLNEVGTYLSIGHDWKGNYSSWVLPRKKKDIIVGDKYDAEFLHDHYQKGVDFKGRIDHDKKQISVVAEWGDKERLDYVVSILKVDYPGYEIWLFGYGPPKQL